MDFPTLRRTLAAIAAMVAAGALAPCAGVAQSPSGPPSAGAQPTPAQARALEALRALKSRDLTTLRTFLQQAFSPAALASRSVEQRQDLLLEEIRKLRGGAIVRWENVGATEARLVYRNDLFGRLEAIRVKVEESAPHRIVEFAGPTALPTDEPAPRSDAELAARLHAFARRMADQDFFSGTILIARGDRPILARAYGLAERRFGAPNRLDTRMRLASITKLFTAVAIGQLVDRGRVSLDDPLSRFVPDAPGTGRILIRHLLVHMSGLGDWGRGDAVNNAFRLFNVDDWLGLVPSAPLATEPGSTYEYNNHGYDYLGKVIEVASGQDYYSYLRDHVFRPAGMVNSACPYFIDSVPNTGVPYQLMFDYGPPFYGNMTMVLGGRGAPSGCAVSTVEDMARFATALRNGTLLRPETVRTFMTPRPETGDELQALGFVRARLARSEIMFDGHGGNALGSCTEFGMLDHQGTPWTFVILANSGLRACYPIFAETKRLLAERLTGRANGGQPATAAAGR